MDDADLLQRYAQSRSEGAFAELVRRHVDLVYSAALRQVGGDPHRAEEVTQMVFISLARKASSLARHPVLLAWLHQSTRFAAANVRREEGRRSAHERAAAVEAGGAEGSEDPAEWERLRPVLDDAVNELNRSDREAVLLRFFANQPFAEVGRKLGLSENTARMRVERALAKLQSGLARRGITSTAAALSIALSGNAVLAAPAGIATSAAGAALTSAVGGGLGFIHLMTSLKLQAGIAGVLLAAGAATVVWQHRTQARLRRDLASFEQQGEFVTVAQGLEQIVRLRGENQKLAERAAAVTDLQAAVAAGTSARTVAARAVAARRAGALHSGTPPVVYQPNQLDQSGVPIYQPHPLYPFALKKEGSSGEAVLEFTVLADGTIAGLKPVKSSEQGFEDAALAAVAKWRFRPGRVGGRAVDSIAQVPIVFSLQDDDGPWF
jgi:RNA polymerase sigma factor (sigma-70 family)